MPVRGWADLRSEWSADIVDEEDDDELDMGLLPSLATSRSPRMRDEAWAPEAADNVDAAL